ncbi:MAG: type VI secretion system baseplate subunit TssE [Janthinobacterium lividum]
MSEVVRGLSVPLFDRLISETGAARAPFFMETRWLRSSIGTELSRLLVTRSSLSFAQFGASNGGAIDYGIPDASALSMRSIEDRATLQAAIEHGIARYCPRLSCVTVDVYESAVCGADARIRISGSMRVGAALARATFVMNAGIELQQAADGKDDE